MRVTSPLTGTLDLTLSNLVIGYSQAALIADQLFPRLPVPLPYGKYFVRGKEHLQTTENDVRAFGTPAQEVRFSLSTATYTVPSHALKYFIPDEDRATYTAGDIESDALMVITDKLYLNREKRVQALVTNPASYAGTNTLSLSGTSKWSNANSDPIGDVTRAKRQIRLTGKEANKLFLSDDVGTILRTHPALLARFTFNEITGPLDEKQLAKALGVPEVVIASAIMDTGTGVNQYLWSNFAMLSYVAPASGPAGAMNPLGGNSLSMMDISFGKTFTWTGGPGTVEGYGVVRARVADPTAKTDILGVDWYCTEKITAPDAAFLWTTPI